MLRVLTVSHPLLPTRSLLVAQQLGRLQLPLIFSSLLFLRYTMYDILYTSLVPEVGVLLPPCLRSSSEAGRPRCRSLCSLFIHRMRSGRLQLPLIFSSLLFLRYTMYDILYTSLVPEVGVEPTRGVSPTGF